MRPTVRLADPRHALLEASSRAALVIVGSRGWGPLRSLVRGSVSIAVARHATCPVVVMRPWPGGEACTRRTGVVVGAGATGCPSAVLRHAFRHASLRGLALTVLEGRPGPTRPADEELDDDLTRLTRVWPDVAVLRRRCDSDIVHELSEATRAANVVVVGSHRPARRRGLTGGGVAAAVVEHARGPVAVVPVGARSGPPERRPG